MMIRCKQCSLKYARSSSQALMHILLQNGYDFFLIRLRCCLCAVATPSLPLSAPTNRSAPNL